MICGWEGEGEAVERRRSIGDSDPALRRRGRTRQRTRQGLGARPLRRPLPARRADGPRLPGRRRSRRRTNWSELSDLHDEVRAAIGSALAAQGTHGLVMCHLSHAYPDGASLYFTFIAPRRPGAELEQWRRREDGRLRGDRRGRRDDHPPPRGRPRPRSLHGSRGRRARHRRPARGQGAPGPGWDHEPGQAAAVRRPAAFGFAGPRLIGGVAESKNTHRGRSRWPTPA